MSKRPIHRIDETFADLASRGRKALIAYVTGGFPSLAAMDRAVRDLENAGVDLVEIGVPFSDPIADGPTIQFSSQEALEAGVTPEKILSWVRRFRRRSRLPLVLMTYLNPVFHRGYARFAREARAAGVDGLIVPDLIPEEAGPLRTALDRQGLHLIHLVAPTTPPERRRRIARLSRGFLYVVSLTGVTGARRDMSAAARRSRGTWGGRAADAQLPAFLKSLRRSSPVPVAVGFGISTPAHARRVAPWADGVIVGSAFIEKLRKKESVAGLARSLRAALV